MKKVTRSQRRSSRPLYPVLLAAFTVSLVGVIWSLQGADHVGVQLDPPGWEQVAEIDLGEMEPRLWEEPIDLAWKKSSDRAFTIQMRQVEQRQQKDRAAVDVRMEFQCDETISEVEEDRLVTRQLTARGLDVQHGDEEINRLLHQQVAMVLDAVSYEMKMDRRGRTEDIRWAKKSNPGLRPLVELVVSMQEMLAPRFPAEPMLIGESWRYDVQLPAAEPGSGLFLEGGVEVTDRLSAVFAVDDRLVAVIDRELTLEIEDRGEAGFAGIRGYGAGTAYFDFESGSLVASELRIRRLTSSAADEESVTDAVSTDIEAVWLPD